MMFDGTFTRTVVCSTTVALVLVEASVMAQSFELAVEKDEPFGASDGTLRVDRDGITYQTDAGDEVDHWPYRDIKQLQVLSPTRLVLKTYEDQGWIKLGADRTLTFDVTDGAVSADLVTFLWSQQRTPMVTAVAPASADTPLEVPVKLRRWIRGSHGTLELYDDYLVYATERVDHARAWRPVDLRMVYQPDRRRLTIDAYEGGGDRTRAFSFDLKQPLPGGFLDRAWQWLHAPTTARIGDRKASP